MNVEEIEFSSPWWKTNLYYPAYRFIKKILPQNLYKEIKWFVQRGRRGWADCDWWSMDYYLAEIIPPMLQEMADKGIGVKANFIDIPDPSDDDLDKLAQKWHDELYKAARDIQAFYEHDETTYDLESRKEREKWLAASKKAEAQTKRGMNFIADNFLDLWD